MRNQCFWISLLNWTKSKNYAYGDIDYTDMTVSQLKTIANDLEKPIDDDDKGWLKVNDDESVINIINDDGTGTYERLDSLALKMNVYIKIMIHDPIQNKIILSKSCTDEGIDDKECKNNESPYTYGNSESENRIMIVSYGSHFELITKLHEGKFIYDSKIQQTGAQETGEPTYYNHHGVSVTWDYLSSEEKQEIIDNTNAAAAKAEAAAAAAAPAPQAASAPPAAAAAVAAPAAAAEEEEEEEEEAIELYKSTREWLATQTTVDLSK